jgi:tRNA A37 threonylcarbamoyladenosine biosynthesis protein TsaE
MLTDELKYGIHEALRHIPTVEQERAMDVFATFMTDRHDQAAMILRGSAGTGKTTLAAAIVRALLSLGQKMVLLAPTGRAAKVFSLYAGQPAYTIHRRIYRQRSLEGAFELNYNMEGDTLFIIDEASMIANSPQSDSVFANGMLLDDLIQFVYNGRNCRMLLIGDSAQLPPVGQAESPALQGAVLRSYGLHVHESTLSEVLRQSQESGILWNATRLRADVRQWADGERPALPQIRFSGFTDISVVPGDELIEQLASSYANVGMDETMVVTRSNKRANIYNQGIRNTVLDREEELCIGDRLMVVKNNYFWINYNLAQSGQLPPQSPTPQPQSNSPQPQANTFTFIANGDMAVVRRVRHVHEQYGFRFAEVTMSFPDYDDYELTATVLLDTLTSEAPALTREQQTLLYNKVLEDYADIPHKQDRLKKLREDRYYNALQVKFAYAATCHKAQGGQWEHIYVDQGYMTDDMLTPDYLHWLYTAFTRATRNLYLVNWPRTQTADDEEQHLPITGLLAEATDTLEK